MLNKIILLNSGKYQKAIITIDKDSIQISGNNNAGKTSLISVLNFLYLPSPKDWVFGGYKNSETLKYYFKNLDKNYIIFEVLKGNCFCILMKRNENNHLVYYRIDSPYDDIQQYFLQNKENNGSILLGFEDINKSLIGKIKLLDKSKFSQLLYGNSKRDKTVLWLESNMQTSFSKVYKYLLNTKLINNEVVKDSLLVSDNKHNITRKFTQNDNDKIKKIKEHQGKITVLENNRVSFNEFKEAVEKHKNDKKILDTNYQDFCNLYHQEVRANQKESDDIKQKMAKLEKVRLEKSSNKEEKLVEIGVLEQKLEYEKGKWGDKNKQIEDIEQYPPRFILSPSLANLKDKYDELNYALSQIKHEQHTLKSISELILTKEGQTKKLQGDIKNFDNLLIHHIAKDENTKQTINNIFTSDVLNLDKRNVISPIQNSDNEILAIFDGKIDISSIQQKQFISIDDLNTQLKADKQQLIKYHTIQTNINNKSTEEEKLKALEEEIAQIKIKLEKIKTLPKLKQELSDLKVENQKLESEKSKLEKSIKILKDELTEINKKINKLSDNEKKDNSDRKGELKVFYTRFENEIQDLQPENKEYDSTIDKLVLDLKKLKEDIYSLKNNKNLEFTRLKDQMGKNNADEAQFITEVEDSMRSIENQKATIKGLMKSISDDISQPTGSFIENLKEFEKHIVTLNTKFKKYRISNLKQIEIKIESNQNLMQDLKQISEINVNSIFEDDNNKKIEILMKYIQQGSEFSLSDLFDVKFIVDGKTANLGKQTESNGTDRMIKIILFMLIIKKMVIQDKNNKLVVYIDELGDVDDGNINQLIQICKENNFVPIFASPDKKPHIAKYYDLIGDEKIVIDENRVICVEDRA